jgi:hypothetical protein
MSIFIFVCFFLKEPTYSPDLYTKYISNMASNSLFYSAQMGGGGVLIIWTVPLSRNPVPNVPLAPRDLILQYGFHHGHPHNNEHVLRHVCTQAH